MVYVFWPQPSTIEGWFALFQKNPIIGLLDYDLLGIIIYIIVIPSILTLYILLRRVSQSWSIIAAALTLMGMATYFGTNTAGSMYSLAIQYVTATTDAQRAGLMAAGQAVLAIFLNSAFTTSFLIVSFSLLITSALMLRSNYFSRRIAYVGIIANIAAMGEYIPLPFAVMMVFGVMNGVGLGIWFTLIGSALYRFWEASSKNPMKEQLPC